MKYWKVVTLGLFVVLIASLSSVSAQAAQGRYTTPQIDARLRNGVNSAQSWDTYCYNYLQGHAGSRFGGDLRYWINSSPSYIDDTWLSQQGRGNISVPITVNEGDTSLDLQINNVTFLCGSLVTPDLAGNASATTCNPNITGWNILNDTSRWVNSPRDVKDRIPNAVGSGCMYPSQTSNVTKITSLTVEPDTTYGGWVDNKVGTMINKSRDDISRYWFGNEIPLKYHTEPLGGGFTKNGKIHLQISYKPIRIFRYATIQCADGKNDPSAPWDVSIANIDQCKTQTRDLVVNIQLRQQFTLNPSIVVTPTSASDDVAMSIEPKVQNAGPTATLDNPGWRVTKFIVDPGKSYAPVGAVKNTSDPCASVSGYKVGSCQTVKSGNRNFSVGSTDLGTFNENTGNLPLGTKICYLLSVRPYKSSVDQWSHTAPGCTIISKQPKVQIWGGDLSVGRTFSGDTSKPKSIVEASTSVKSGGSKTFGSWVEYGIFAPSTISGVSSAAGLAGPDGNLLGAQKDWSKLTFANGGQLNKTTDCNGTVKFGCFATPGGMGAIPDVVGRLAPGTAGTPLGGSVLLDDLGSGTYYANGNLSISASTIAKGKSLIIKARGTVFIDGDIKYTTEKLHSLSDIPQVVIIANNIQIKDTVTNVDAWLIANGAQGVVYTCNNNNFTQKLTGSTCKDKLTINGPVMAKKLFLTRTAGSGAGAASGDPAEVLNLRADAYLWAINRAGGQGSIRTLGTTELAPRF